MPGSQIPHLVFSTDELDLCDRLDAWRQNLAPMFDVAPQVGADHLHAALDIYHLGQVMVGGVEIPAHRFSRNKAWASRSDIDHYFLQLYVDGGYVGRVGERDVEVRPGDVELLHFGQTLDTVSSASRTFGIMIPRAVLDQRINGVADLHGLVLKRESAAGSILGDYLRSLRNTVAGASLDEAPMLAEGCLALIAASLRPSVETMTAASPQIGAVLMDRILHYLDRNLADPSLGTEVICRDFRLSRSYLYALFELHGGVARHIRRRRLHRAIMMLTEPQAGSHRISDIAYACGFNNETNFGRAFRAEYGMTPSEARGLALAVEKTDGTLFSQWVAGLGKLARRS